MFTVHHFVSASVVVCVHFTTFSRFQSVTRIRLCRNWQWFSRVECQCRIGVKEIWKVINVSRYQLAIIFSSLLSFNSGHKFMTQVFRSISFFDKFRCIDFHWNSHFRRECLLFWMLPGKHWCKWFSKYWRIKRIIKTHEPENMTHQMRVRHWNVCTLFVCLGLWTEHVLMFSSSNSCTERFAFFIICYSFLFVPFSLCYQLLWAWKSSLLST